MANEPETFLWLSTLAWTAISSIATALAVIVALLLPFYLDWKKRKNLSVLIEDEIKRNLDVMKKADEKKDSKLPTGEVIYKVDLMCTILIHLDTHIWEQNRQTIAEISSDKYLKYLELENTISEIKKYAIQIIESKGNTPTNLLEIALKETLKPAITKLKNAIL